MTLFAKRFEIARWIWLPAQMLAVFGLSGLTACGQNAGAANERNFRQALEEVLSKQRACVYVGTLPARPYSFEVERKHLNLFVKYGVLEIAEVPYRSVFGGSPSPGATKKEYRLTARGKQFARPNSGGFGFDLCYAKPRLKEIIRWSQPAPSFGTIQAQVTYTVTLGEVADWARDPEFRRITQLGLLFRDLDGAMERKSILTQTNTGWYDAEKWQAAVL